MPDQYADEPADDNHQETEKDVVARVHEFLPLSSSLGQVPSFYQSLIFQSTALALSSRFAIVTSEQVLQLTS